MSRRVEKPWGHEIIWAETPMYVGKILSIAPGCTLSLQYHRVKEETIRVMRGRLLVTYAEVGCWPHAEQQLVLAAGETFHVPPTMVHRFVALEDEVELVEVSTPELDDVVRIADKYGRAERTD